MQPYNNHSKVVGGEGVGAPVSLCCKNDWACFNEVALPYHNVNIYLLKWYENPESAEMPYKLLIKILVTECAGHYHSTRVG